MIPTCWRRFCESLPRLSAEPLSSSSAGFAEGGLKPLLWLAALAVSYLVPLVVGIGGWRVQPAHFVERHGLIVIIAIGESLVAIGLGERASGISTERDGRRDARFAVATLVLARLLRLLHDPRRADPEPSRSGVERTALARDVFTYLHLPMVAGIVLFAFAMKKTLADVGGELATIPALGLCGGPALYLFAFVAIRVRVARTIRGGRLIAAIACAMLWPVAVLVPALVALTLVAAVWIGLHAYEVIWWREARAQTRALRASAS